MIRWSIVSFNVVSLSIVERKLQETVDYKTHENMRQDQFLRFFSSVLQKNKKQKRKKKQFFPV